jgi:hypothetical protein
MFNLIITIISIALVAVLAIATIYYGGAAFTQGSAKAGAATLVSHAQQIAAANTLYANDHGGTFTVTDDDLLDGYLTAMPLSPNATGSYNLGTDVTASRVEAVLPATSSNICIEVNKTLDAAATAVLVAEPATKQYGCFDTDGVADVGGQTTPMTFFYKG